MEKKNPNALINSCQPKFSLAFITLYKNQNNQLSKKQIAQQWFATRAF